MKAADWIAVTIIYLVAIAMTVVAWRRRKAGNAWKADLILAAANFAVGTTYLIVTINS